MVGLEGLRSGDLYTEPYEWKAPIVNAASATVTLTLPATDRNGGTCHHTFTLPTRPGG